MENYDLTNTDAMTVEQLHRHRERVRADGDKLHRQLAGARSARRETGKPADESWYVRTRQAYQMKRQALNALDRIIADRQRAQRAQECRKFETAFVNAARLELEDEDFQAISAIARAAAERGA